MDITSSDVDLLSSDISELAILMANMIDSFLYHKKLHEKNKYEQQNSSVSQRKISICLPEAINNGASAPQQRKHRASICLERQGRIVGLAAAQNQSAG